MRILDRAGFRRQTEDGVLRLGVQDQTSGVGLGVATDDEDLLAHFDQGGQGVLGGCRLPDAAFTVECDLTQRHVRAPF